MTVITDCVFNAWKLYHSTSIFRPIHTHIGHTHTHTKWLSAMYLHHGCHCTNAMGQKWCVFFYTAPPQLFRRAIGVARRVGAGQWCVYLNLATTIYCNTINWIRIYWHRIGVWPRRQKPSNWIDDGCFVCIFERLCSEAHWLKNLLRRSVFFVVCQMATF